MLSLDTAQRVFHKLNEAFSLDALGDLVLTLDGAGDPLLNPHFDEIVRSAKACGVRAIHLRTELICDRPTLNRLLSCGVDVVSVDLNADRAATYRIMMGFDRFKDVLMNIDHLVQHRRRLTNQAGGAGFALPWIVPRLQRRLETYEDIDTFYDRWQHALGVAVIEDPPYPLSNGLTPAVTPARVLERERQRCMTILCDGSVPNDYTDFSGNHCLGNITETAIGDLWKKLQDQRPCVVEGTRP